MILSKLITDCHSEQWLELKTIEYQTFFEGTVAEAITLYGDLYIAKWLSNSEGTLLITMEVKRKWL